MRGRTGASNRPGLAVLARAMAMSAERLRALRLLAAAPNGATEAIMLAHGFTVEMLGRLVLDGHATATPGIMYAGGRPITVTWLTITDIGRRLQGDGRWACQLRQDAQDADSLQPNEVSGASAGLAGVAYWRSQSQAVNQGSPPTAEGTKAAQRTGIVLGGDARYREMIRKPLRERAQFERDWDEFESFAQLIYSKVPDVFDTFVAVEPNQHDRAMILVFIQKSYFAG
jgi:hypothetical protein